MLRIPIFLTTSLILAMALSGCVGGDGDDEPESAAGPGPVEATPGETTGSVKGQVVTTELDEVGGAAVAVTQGNTIVQDVKTDPSGNFVFNDLAPGDYRVQVSALCCRAAAEQVTVTAGQVADVGFQLEPFSSDDLQVPYVKEWEWSGFISCGVATPAVRVAVCSVTGGTPAEDPNEDFFENWSVAKGLETLSIGMTWQPVGGVSGGEFRLLVEENVCEEVACADAYRFAAMEGPPDLIENIDNDDIDDPAFKWDNITESFGLQFRVFAGGDLTLIYQQPFTVYIKEFYWEPAPEDFDPIPDQ